jgi:hypothetical protein
VNTVDHVLRNTRAVLSVAFSAGDADGDAVTVNAVDASGRPVVTGASAVPAVASGVYTYALSPQPAVASLTLTWAGSFGGVAQSIRSRVEVVGGYLFNLAQARVFDDGALGDVTKYPDATIREVRAGITEFFRDVAGRSFVPMYGREAVDGTADGRLFLRAKGVRSLLAASVAGTALTVDELAAVGVYDSGMLTRSNGWNAYTPRAVVVEYEYGDEFPPWAIHEAALVYLRYLLVSSDLSDRTITFTNEAGTVRNAVASIRYPTGLPTVDAMLGRYSRKRLLA